MSDAIRNLKVRRTETFKKIRSLATRVHHIINGDIPAEGHLGEHLLELDNLLNAFDDDHNAMNLTIAVMEAQTAGSGQKESRTNGLSMSEYRANMMTSYNTAVREIKEKLEEQRELEKRLAAQTAEQEKEAHDRLLTHTSVRAVKSMMRTVNTQWRCVGDEIIDNLDDIRKMAPEEITELQSKLDATENCLAQLETSIESLVKLNTSEVHDVIQEAECLSDVTRDKIDSIQARLSLSRPNPSPSRPYPVTPRRGQLTTYPSIGRLNLSPHIQAGGIPSHAEPDGEDISTSTTGKLNPKPFKFESVKFPTFDGNRRNWARFRSTWMNIVEPQGFSRMYLATQLWECTKKGHAKSLIEAVTIKDDDSYLEMWDRLEAYYSDTGSILQDLLHQIEKLKGGRRNKSHEIIKFVNEVEIIHESLRSISEEYPKKINCLQVDKLAECMPVEVEHLWLRHYEDLPKDAKESPFSEFTKFCVKERSMRLRFINFNDKPKSTNSYGSAAESKNRQPTKQKHCWLDNSHHGHYTCHCDLWGSLSPTERRHACLENKKCIVCMDSFGKGHQCRPIRPHILNKYHCKECRIKHRNDIACPSKKKEAMEADVESGSISSGTAYIARYEVKVKGQTETVPLFADNGSDISFVNEQSAKKRGYKQVGTRILNITTINGIKQVRTKIYNVPIIRIDGQIENIQCHSINKPVTNRSKGVNLKEVGKLFPKYKPLNRLDRDERPCEILLGLDYHQLHPNKTVGRNKALSISRGLLGDTLIGSISSNNDNNEESWSAHSYYITKAQDSQWNKFIQGEDLGIAINISCEGCKCGGCPLVGHRFSFKEEQEMNLIKSGLTFNDGRWTCKIPWIKSPESLPDNKYVAESTLKSTIRTLEKDPAWYETYNQQIKDLEERGICKRLSKEDLEYQGPKFYICHLAVLSPKSTSTPIRIVFNSSQTCRGISLNSYQAKGPKIMNSLLGILLRWREYPGVLLADISKMFYSIALTKEDQHLHRFLWKSTPDAQTVQYMMTALSMGDMSSPCIAMTALALSGENAREEEPEVCRILKDDSYVDDIASSTLQNPVELARKVDNVLKSHGFVIKQWQFNGQSTNTTKLLKGDGEITSVLGVSWNAKLDVITFKAHLNFSKKKRGVYTEPDLKSEEFQTKFPKTLTKRMVLEQVMRIFDPLGLLSPHVLKAKILLRETWEENLGWDEELPQNLYLKWKLWLQTCFQVDKTSFHRCTGPWPDEPKQEDPELIIFSDGSIMAAAACAYVRWKLDDGYKSYLMMAKNRIGPKNALSVPRMELNGGVIGARLRQALKACRYKFSKIIHLVDSEIVLNQVNSLSTKFKAYEGNRIGEIQRICEGDMSNWFWLPGTENIADWNTRGKNPEELGSESEWQLGPEFMAKPIEEWPIKSVNEIRVKIPEEVEIKTTITDTGIICFDRVSKFETLVNAIAIVITSIQNKSFKNAKNFNVETSEKAKLRILKEAQTYLHQPQINYKKQGVVLTKEDLWAVGVRNTVTEQDLQILLPYEHRVATLLMDKAHRDSRHSGRDSTVAMFRNEYYIKRATKKAKAVRERCTKCRKEDQKAVSQKMGKVPLISLKEAPVFQFTQLDLIGPWKVRGEVNKRTTGKCWACIFVCLASKAVHIEIICGYSTDNFLLGLQNFGSLRGWPGKIFSDPGSQLIGAANELVQAWKLMSQSEIQKLCLSKKTEWIFSPADSPHYQGAAESLIRVVKRAVATIYSHDKRLSYPEYVTLGHNVADLINSRPLGIMGESGSELTILTPNSLILGRNKSENPRCYPEGTSIPRTTQINEVISRFWKRWIEIVKPAMILAKKWHNENRNLCVGDVVLILENDPLTKTYKLARVSETLPSEDGLVRKVKLKYMQYKKAENGTQIYTGGNNQELTRSIHRLVLIVPIEELTTHKNDY